jgi:hypothetical protein
MPRHPGPMAPLPPVHVPATPNPTARVGGQAGANLSAWSTAAQRGRASILTATAQHRDSIARTGVGVYYGNNSDFSRLPKTAQDAWVQAHLVAGSQAPALHESSCIAWSMQHLAAVYTAAGKSARWQEIEAAVRRDDMRGSTLARELQKDGWQALYFNPDDKEHQDQVRDRRDAHGTPILDAHGNPIPVLDASGHRRHFDEQGSSLSDLNRTGKYYGLSVDDRILNYNRVPGSGRHDDLTAIEKLRHEPFFFGITRGGEHTFVGHDGTISELHYEDNPDNPNVTGEARFETKDGSGDREFKWHSGAVLVPPGTWPK